LAVVRQIGPVAADAGRDRLAGFGMLADFARQAQQLERPVEIEIGQVLRDRGALGILAVAQLHVRSEAAGTARDRQAALRIGSDDAIVFLAILRRLPELPSEIAFRIVRTSDEGA